MSRKVCKNGFQKQLIVHSQLQIDVTNHLQLFPAPTFNKKLNAGSFRLCLVCKAGGQPECNCCQMCTMLGDDGTVRGGDGSTLCPPRGVQGHFHPFTPGMPVLHPHWLACCRLGCRSLNAPYCYVSSQVLPTHGPHWNYRVNHIWTVGTGFSVYSFIIQVQFLTLK